MKRTTCGAWVLGILLFSISVQGYFPCPYSGPTENPNETRFQVEEYLIEIEVIFPDETHEGLVRGQVVMECVSKINDLDRIELDFFSSEKSSVSDVLVDGVSTDV